MKLSIQCCETFPKILHNLQWMKIEDEGSPILVMPYILSLDSAEMLRVNHCPSCGKEVRNIELTK